MVAAVGKRRTRPRARPGTRPHERLAAALASGAVTVERVAEVLKVDPQHVYELAAGRIGLAPSAWKRVMNELEVDAP